MIRTTRFGDFSRRRVILGGVTAALAVSNARLAAAQPAPVVVELFTSQGCNSCPPADAYLAELARQPGILPLAYHIDYWDRLGWRDPFSSPAATARQTDYAHALRLKTVYTPQMVINGRYDAVGSDRREVAAAIAAAGSSTGAVPVELLAENGALSVRLGAGIGQGRVFLIAYDLRHETRVRGGENAGRTLVNTNIVRAIEELGAWTGGALTRSRPLPPPGTGIAVLLQSSDGAIIGAAATAAAERKVS
ncbi:MAG TPA: DUF1223 domain-containing protein [Alphaproteobacteria bacterium]